jgi:hypothetical protein
MPLFEKKYIDYLTIHKIPIGLNQLDPTVFAFFEAGEEPRLLEGIHAQITRDLEVFTSGQHQRIEGYYLVGPATIPKTRAKLQNSKPKKGKNLIVKIKLNTNLKDIDVHGSQAEALLNLAKQLSGKYAGQSSWIIVYDIIARPIEEYGYKGVYDLFKSCWKTIPNGLTK